MHVRAKCGNPGCVGYSIEKVIVVGQLGKLTTLENELICRLCREPMKIAKKDVDDGKRPG